MSKRVRAVLAAELADMADQLEDVIKQLRQLASEYQEVADVLCPELGILECVGEAEDVEKEGVRAVSDS